MKNLVKKVSAVFICLIITAVSSAGIGAATYYNQDGYRYYLDSSGYAYIAGSTSGASELEIPLKFDENYVMGIADAAFFGSKITSVSFAKANMCHSIGDSAFYDCVNLTGIVLPTWVNKLSMSSFDGCSSLESVTIYGSVKEIPEQCFYRCSSLKAFTVPNSCVTIGRYAFGDCTSLTEITIPKKVRTIEDYAFDGDSNVTIKCYKDSAADHYAKNNNISYILLDADPEPEYKVGDVNMDGLVNISDATLIQRYKAEIERLSESQIKLADVDGSGEITIADATRIQYIVAEIIKA